MPDKDFSEHIEHCRRMAAQAEAKVATCGADLRDTWSEIAESWHALARELQHDAAPIDWSASALEQNRDTVGSPHVLKTLLTRQRYRKPS